MSHLDLALTNCKIKKIRRERVDMKPHTIDLEPPAELLSSSAEVYTFNDSDEMDQDLCVVEMPTATTTTKLDQSYLESDPNSMEMSAADKLKSQAAVAASSRSTNNKKRRIRRDSGTSSEEERWLDAIESGKLMIKMVK